MAKRTRAGAATDRLNYEEYHPMAEWREQEENNFLIVHLPGFTKEQVRISCVRSSRLIRLQGERQLADKKWSQVNEAFPIPENCNIDKVRASWQDGVVTITLPKTTFKKQIAREEESKTTAQEAPLQPRAAAVGDQPKPSKIEQEAAYPKATATTSNTTSAKATSSDVHGQKQEDGKSVEASSAQKPEKEVKPQKGKDETPPQVASAVSTTKQTERKSEEPKAENIEQLGNNERNEVNAKPAELKKAGDVVEKSLIKEKESSSRGKEYTAAETFVSKTSDKEKEKRGISAAGKEKREEYSSASAKAKEMKSTITAATKKAMKTLATEKSNEERQLMVNMGVAVLVILALGAYVSYSFASKAKD